ncbi:DUF2867 domain-containing protein [Agromyces agglutinans]|nr:DUF2867 domain-containing protein [Agromyces agglutinans]
MLPRPRAYSAEASPTALLAGARIRNDWSSRQRQPVTSRASADPAEWTRLLFHTPPTWVVSGLAIRDRLVALVGLRPVTEDTFRVLAQSEQEVLLGSDDRHLDFRASVRCAHGTVDVVTFVQVHNALGWLYLVPVRLVHSMIVRRMLRHAADRLDPGRSSHATVQRSRQVEEIATRVRDDEFRRIATRGGHLL